MFFSHLCIENIENIERKFGFTLIDNTIPDKTIQEHWEYSCTIVSADFSSFNDKIKSQLDVPSDVDIVIKFKNSLIQTDRNLQNLLKSKGNDLIELTVFDKG